MSPPQKTGRDDGDATRSPDQYDDNAYDDLDMGDLNVEDDDDDYYDDTAFHSYNARNNRSRNTKPQGYMCDKCKQDFQSYAARLQHYRTSTKHHVCVHCRDDVDYLNIVHLRTHWKQTHRDTYCHLCDKHFPNKQKLHAHVEKEHYPCEPCKTYYKTEGLLHEHWKTSEQHQNASCGQCGLVFEDEYFLHMHESSGHESQEGLAGASGSKKRERAAGTEGDDLAPPDHYGTLGISRRSSPEDIVKAAKEMRIKTHPDRLKRNPNLTPEALAKIDADAARVGWAADILLDTHMRRKYDAQLQAWDGNR